MNGVFELFAAGGHIMWVILLAGIAMLVIAGRTAAAIRARSADIARDIDAVAFWGAFAALLGVLGTVVGLTIMARAVERAGDVSAQIAWSGIGVALITTVFGLCIFVLALLLWVVLRHLHSRAIAGH